MALYKNHGHLLHKIYYSSQLSDNILQQYHYSFSRLQKSLTAKQHKRQQLESSLKDLDKKIIKMEKIFSSIQKELERIPHSFETDTSYHHILQNQLSHQWKQYSNLHHSWEKIKENPLEKRGLLSLQEEIRNMSHMIKSLSTMEKKFSINRAPASEKNLMMRFHVKNMNRDLFFEVERERLELLNLSTLHRLLYSSLDFLDIKIKHLQYQFHTRLHPFSNMAENTSYGPSCKNLDYFHNFI